MTERSSPLRVGLIGAGLQGKRRAPAIQNTSITKLVVVSADLREADQAVSLGKIYGCESTTGWEQVVERPDLDIIVICTPPFLHAKIAISAMNAGKHVLCEKPLSTKVEEAEAMVEAAKANKVKLKCGLNHRFHPAILKAKQLVDEGQIGDPNFVRCRYGISGRPGYENEWRAMPDLAGGGELMDQGTHAIDLSRWFLGEFSEVSAFIANYMPTMKQVEDNGFVLLRTPSGRIASIHASLTQWKNLFCFELFGTKGYLIVDGLGGSYGNERLAFGIKDLSKPFTEEVTEYRGDDRSWYTEWIDFIKSINDDREPVGNGNDGLITMQIVNSAYKAANEHSVLQIYNINAETRYRL